VAALLVLGAGLAVPVSAQVSEGHPPSSSLEGTQEQQSDPERLPSWAEPRSPERGRPPAAPKRGRGGPGNSGSVATNGFNKPEPGSVPLGGAEWLAGAGAAYAIRRLLQDGGEEGGDDEPA
jgi:hypothetical protein